MSNFNITNEQILLISILNTMYNDNIRQIETLTQHNDNIRNSIISMLYGENANNTNNTNNSIRNRSNNLNASFNSLSNYRRSLYNLFDTIATDDLNYRVSDNFNRTNNISQNRFNRINNRSYNRNNNDNSNVNLNTNLNANANSNLNTNSNASENTFSYLEILNNFLNPVIIHPTQSQIENAVRNVRYGDIVRPVSRSCPISLEHFNEDEIVSVIRHCGHIFNRNQLTTWFMSNCRCPVCRYDIRTYSQREIRDPNNNNTDVSNNPINNYSWLYVTEQNQNDNTTMETNNNTNNTNNNTNSSITNLYTSMINSLNEEMSNSNYYDSYYIDIIFDPSGNIVNNNLYGFISNANRNAHK